MKETIKILAVRWFSGRDCIGIVLIHNGFKHKSYIGVGKGLDEKEDIHHIANYGTFFPVKHAMELTGYKQKPQ